MPTLIVNFEIKGTVEIPTDNKPTEHEMERLVSNAYKNVEVDVLREADFDEDSLWIEESDWKW